MSVPIKSNFGSLQHKAAFPIKSSVDELFRAAQRALSPYFNGSRSPSMAEERSLLSALEALARGISHLGLDAPQRAALGPWASELGRAAVSPSLAMRARALAEAVAVAPAAAVPAKPVKPSLARSAQKVKLGRIAAPVDDLLLPKMANPLRVSMLCDAASVPQVMLTNRFAAGSYGKVALGREVGPGVPADAAPIALKLMRKEAWRPSATNTKGPGVVHTYPTPGKAAAEEFKLLRRLHGEAVVRGLWRTPKWTILASRLMAGDLHRMVLQRDALEHEALGLVPHGQPAIDRRISAFILAAQQLAPQLLRLHTTLKIIHRDIKPANILCDAEGNLFLWDLGLAAPIQDPQDGSRCLEGTPGHTAPEAHTLVDADGRIDVFSLGQALLPLLVPGKLMVSPFSLRTPLEWLPEAGRYATVRNAAEDQAMQQVYRTFIGEITDARGNIDVRRLRSNPFHDTLEAHGAPLVSLTAPFHQYFASIAQMHPALCTDLLRHLLNPDPNARFDSAQLLIWSQHLPPALHTSQELWQPVANANQGQKALLDALDRDIRARRRNGTLPS